MKTILKSFSAGFLSTFIFHQGLFGLYYQLGLKTSPPYNMSPNTVGVPSVVSLAFFAGLWAVLIWQLVRSDTSFNHWIKAFVYGAIGPTALAFLVVFPLKGISIGLSMLPLSLLLNGVWSLGTSFIMKFLKNRQPKK